MKNYHNLHTLATTVLLLFVSFTVFGQQAVEKTLVKSFNLGGTQTVALDIDAPVQIQESNNNLLRVQMKIRLENGSEALLKSLVRAGRYNLKHEITEEGTYKIFAPDLGMEVKIGGKPLQDQVSFVISKPKNTMLDAPALEANEEAAATASSL
jgi:hypothetical protein